MMFCFPTKPERAVTTDTAFESADRMVNEIKDDEREKGMEGRESQRIIKTKRLANLQIRYRA